MKRIIAIIIIVVTTMLIVSCRDSEIASYNISKEADQFRIKRRVIFYNSITDTIMFEMTGNLAVNIDRENVLTVTAKIGNDKYRKHYLGLSDNVTYIKEKMKIDYKDGFKYRIGNCSHCQHCIGISGKAGTCEVYCAKTQPPAEIPRENLTTLQIPDFCPLEEK